MARDRPPYTVSQLGRRFELSRTALLHYDAIGLLRPSARSRAGYRQYSAADAARLEEICRLRKAGVSLATIGRALDGSAQTLAEVLRARLEALRQEMGALRQQERFVLGLLSRDEAHAEAPMDKGRWVALLRAAGYTNDDMRRWHAAFERQSPADHQRFLEFLNIPAAEIARIRAAARAIQRDKPGGSAARARGRAARPAAGTGRRAR